MIRIAVVEDDPGYRQQLTEFIRRCEEEQGDQFKVTMFADGLEIAEEYAAAYDIIFLDIQMEHLDGMATAKRIRQQDKNVVIIFITNLAQYALQGYQVEALDYVLKPLSYFAFSQELKKAVRKVRERSACFLHLVQESGMVRLDVSAIRYIESAGHNVVYHTAEGDYTNRESLKSVEQKLEGRHFSRCNNCYLVNLSHVERADKMAVVVDGIELQMSRPRRKAFMEALAAYVGGE
ncbi:MAG: LytTR family DNA-binding domain-containing protein [Clostridiales bacterium]|nr:LytTR family DNA-binding domain-containing protein [Clostridiales bacterium]